MSFKILAEMEHSRVSGHSESSTSVSQWFRSKPMKVIGPFALQLETRSSEAIKSGDPNFWFEISLFDDGAKTPVKTWFSHMNESVATFHTDVWHFGPIFDPNHELIRGLKVGDVIGVGIGSNSRGKWSLQVQGRLVVKPLASLLPLTEHLTWSLRDSPEEGVYTISTSKECVSSVTTAHGNRPVNNVWFKTPPLPEDIVSRLNSVKLFTNARHQGYSTDKRQGIWSWFDLAAFEDEDEEETPLSDDGGPLIALSHKIAANANHTRRQEGKLFSHGDDFVSRLKAGDVIGVRVCAQYSGWENYAAYGRLLIGLSERNTPPLPPDEEKLKDFTLQLLSMVMAYDKNVLKGVLKELEVSVLSKE